MVNAEKKNKRSKDTRRQWPCVTQRGQGRTHNGVINKKEPEGCVEESQVDIWGRVLQEGGRANVKTPLWE